MAPTMRLRLCVAFSVVFIAAAVSKDGSDMLPRQPLAVDSKEVVEAAQVRRSSATFGGRRCSEGRVAHCGLFCGVCD